MSDNDPSNVSTMDTLMRARTLLAFLIVAGFSFGVGRAAEPLSKFRINVTFDSTTNQIALECTAGCAWETLRFRCADQGECESPIDEYGMTK